MTSIATTLRAELAAALGPVLPGRVHAYRPAKVAAAGGVLVWIGEHTYAPSFAGIANSGTLAYTITVVADGADRAAGAMLDELVATCADAVRAAGGGWSVDGWTPTTVGIDADRELPGYELVAIATVFVDTFCTEPAVVPVIIPAIPVEVP